jgi:hypothetical protein
VVTLGRWLGFSAWKSNERGAPDALWPLGDYVVLAFEAKSDELPDSYIPIRDVRETAGHLDWLGADVHYRTIARQFVTLISPRSALDPAARPFCRDARYMWLDDFRRWAIDVVSKVERLRSQMSGDLFRDQEIIGRFIAENGLSVDLIIETLTSINLSALP